ncbi:CHAD domain-containing protein [Nocardioides stalactiti]|uniref:CHAD domain-containing protein n=1 Tax=Nocardioides stalactiti TaxID=2755356 RepID=UPI0015FF53FA|nr:CHAD domain-containing protein [Nocardioides stalactiti]
MTGQPTAGEMLAEIVGDLVAAIDAKGDAALADEPDAVHQLRTSVRRLRNVLAAFSELFEPSSAGRIRAGLADHGDHLGLVRDLEVRIESCVRVAGEVGVADDLVAALVAPLRVAHVEAHAALVAWVASEESVRLRSALLAWSAAPVLAAGSARPAGVVAAEKVATQVDRVLAHGREDLADAESAHALRKAGRRLRHVADAVTRPPASVLGDDAAALGKLGARIQTLLGDHRDALLLVDHVRRALPSDPAARAECCRIVAAAEAEAAAVLGAVPGLLTDLEASSARGRREGWTSGSAS